MDNTGKTTEKWFNIPNILTFFRFALIPLVIILVVQNKMIWALAAFLIACITDLLDGFIARKYNLISKLGIWLDPLADKCMALAVLITFTFCRIVPFWVTVVILAKEVLMLLGGFFALRNGHSTPSNKYGKIAAFILNVSIAAGFLCNLLYPWYLYAIYVALAATLIAFAQYAIKNVHLCFEKAPSKEDK